jgi:hypothetical protein
MEYIVEPGKFNLWIGGDSQADLMTEFRLEIGDVPQG